jgi:hypothetical protein
MVIINLRRRPITVICQCFCRDTYVFWIGSCGGVYQYVENKSGSGCRKVYRKGGTVERMTY